MRKPEFIRPFSKEYFLATTYAASTYSSRAFISRVTSAPGCFQREKVATRERTHGGTGTRLHDTWCGMIRRCENARFKEYASNGGRGIRVCEAWRHDFAAFRDWATSHGYADNLTIDRINNDDGYSPDNCQWLSRSDNAKKQHQKVAV